MHNKGRMRGYVSGPLHDTELYNLLDNNDFANIRGLVNQSVNFMGYLSTCWIRSNFKLMTAHFRCGPHGH